MAGATTVTATSGALSGSATLTVTATAPSLSSITVTPAVANARQFTATGSYSGGSTADITSTVTWTSGTPSVATIDATGLATGGAAGTTTITAASGAISGSATLTVTSGGAGNWSSPQALIGGASSDRAAYPDLNGNLQFTTRASSGAANPGRAHRQFLKNDGTVTAAEVYPPFPSANPAFNDRGAPYDIITELNGTRMVIWGVLENTGLVMSWQGANGAFGPNIVSLGVNPAAIAYRNGLVIVLSIGTNGVVQIREWDAALNGTLSARPEIYLIDAEFSGCGGVVAIEADGSATAVFNLSDRISGQITAQVLSAQRSTAGAWVLNPIAIDSSNSSVQTFGCVYGAASPSGRLLAAWWRQGTGDTSNVDRGGEIKALLKEPGAALPSTLLSFHAAPLDLVSGNKRRNYGINVAMGLDGTAGLIAKTGFCTTNGTRYFSSGLLRLAGPNQDFYKANNLGLTAMDSSAQEVFTDADLHTPASAFAVENRRAIIGISRISYPDVGTDLTHLCHFPPRFHVFSRAFGPLTRRVIEDGIKMLERRAI